MGRKWVSQFPYEGNVISAGISADNLIELMGKPSKTETVGRDQDGLVVEWFYSAGVIFTLAYQKAMNILDGGDVYCYIVQKVEEVSNESNVVI